MRSIVVLLALLLAQSFSSAAEDERLAALAWIGGTWAGTNGEVQMEEHWTQPAGGMILGVHRDLFPQGRTFFEFLRIEQRGDEIVYIAMPRGKDPTAFTLTELTENRAVFENPEHDFPQRIIYSRDGETLSAMIEGYANGEQRRSGWQWQRVQP